ncbi:MAG: hypothetical protein MUF21_07905 [Gemmatimonadaceae bacterium]|nr:hypothetical protein [Gemmatimonadaceae bacterium]
MTPLLRAQAALAFIGVALFGWSIYADDERVRLAAIGTLAVALVLRFVRRAAARRNEDAT